MVELSQTHLQTILLLFIILLGLMFVLPFLSTLLLALVLAYLTHPLYERMKKRMPENIAAFAVCFGVIAVIATIAIYGINFIIHELGNVYLFIANAEAPVIGTEFGESMSDMIWRGMSSAINWTSDQVKTIPSLVISTFLFFIALFYFLKQGDKVFRMIWNIVPITQSKKGVLLKNVRANVDAFVYVTLIIGLIQGVLAVIGFYIFGIGYPILGGATAAILSMIPVLGPYLLYISLGGYLFAKGSIGLAVGILLYGLISGSLLDYVLRPYLFSRKAKTHPLVVFLGIFGGLHLLGMPGIVIGPIVLSVAGAFIKDINLYGIK